MRVFRFEGRIPKRMWLVRISATALELRKMQMVAIFQTALSNDTPYLHSKTAVN